MRGAEIIVMFVFDLMLCVNVLSHKGVSMNNLAEEFKKHRIRYLFKKLMNILNM